jgi:hypothetical protein
MRAVELRGGKALGQLPENRCGNLTSAVQSWLHGGTDSYAPHRFAAIAEFFMWD